MIIQELDREILLRKEELEDKNKKDAYEFISDFMEENDIYDIVDFVYMDIWEFLKCSMYINCKEKDINRISYAIDKSKKFFDNVKTTSAKTMLLMLRELSKANKISELISFFKIDGFFNEAKQTSSFKDINGVSAIKLSMLKKKLEADNIDLVPFLELLDSNGEDFFKEMAFYLLQRDILDFLKNKVFEVYLNSDNERELKEKKISVLTKELRGSFDIEEILNKMSKVREFKEEYERVEKNNVKERLGLDNARLALEKELDKKQIVNYRDIIKGIKSPKMKYIFLKFIKEHNEEYYNELEEELHELKQDSKVSIQALLNDYGISKDSYDYDTLPRLNKEELESILRVITKLNISNDEKIRIIKSTSLSKIKTLNHYLDRGILTVDYVSKNTNILDEDNISLDNLQENINLLRSNSISVSIFTSSINILMNDKELIKNNLNKLKTYNLLNQLNNTNDYRFLLSDNLETIIDKYLELGFEIYLENDLNLLNKQEIERIEVLRSIGIPIESREELEKYLDEEKDFFIPIEGINNYLIDDSKYVEEPSETVELERLEQYKNNRVYDFDGVKISIEKVNRLTNNGYTLYQAIINNTYLSEDELLSIVKIISNSNKKELKNN